MGSRRWTDLLRNTGLRANLIGALAMALGLVTAAVLPVTAGAATSHRPPAAFAWLVPAAPPANWVRVPLPDGAAVFSYPPTLRRIHADVGALAAGIVTAPEEVVFPVYLNATPKQGDESLQSWPRFRIAHNADDGTHAIHTVASARNLTFRGGRGSCVIDSNVTNIHDNPFEEIACFVQGPHGGSVIVAASPTPLFHRHQRLLEQAVADYQAR